MQGKNKRHILGVLAPPPQAWPGLLYPCHLDPSQTFPSCLAAPKDCSLFMGTILDWSPTASRRSTAILNDPFNPIIDEEELPKAL